MKFKSVSVNNCYILDEEIFNNSFFTYLNAKAIYSASMFHLAFFKGNLDQLTEEEIKHYKNYSIDLYRLNSPYLYVPFEINFHENYLYQSYYESDHFPLSVWIEEKSLIPFSIFVQIIEETLLALKALEDIGHSHLFLTPEEILLPLQWKNDTHVKIFNIGLNSIVHSVFKEKETNEYRKKYFNGSTVIVERKLIKNIAEDLYSIGTILNTIVPLCNFNDETDKKDILKSIDALIKKPETFNTIDEVLLLFDKYLIEKNKTQTINNKTIDYTYTGQASFDIPEFNEWTEEAELEPLPENENIVDDKEIRSSKTEKTSILKSVTSLFFRLFSWNNKKKYVSKTLVEFAENQNSSENKKNNFEDTNSEPDFQNKQKSEHMTSLDSSLQTSKILKEIENHYKTEIKKDKMDKVINNSGISTDKNNSFSNLDNRDYTNTQEGKSPVINKDTTGPHEIIEIFNNSLLERDYSKSYGIIQDLQKIENKSTDKDVKKELEELIDNKLKQLDDHYIKNEDSNIVIKLAKLDSALPGEGRKLDVNIEKKLNESDSEIFHKEKLNLFQKIILFLKSRFSKHQK